MAGKYSKNHDMVAVLFASITNWDEMYEESYEGIINHFICFSFLQNPKEPIAVRVFSMTVLAQIAKKQPGLKKELTLMIEDQLPYAGPAFRSRARKVLWELNS